MTKRKQHVASEQIFIADPRIPAAKLEFTSNYTIYKPNKVLPLEVCFILHCQQSDCFQATLSTYSGSSIADASIHVRWVLERKGEIRPYGDALIRDIVPKPPLENEQGEFNVTTNTDGKAVVSFDPRPLLKKPAQVISQAKPS